MVLPDSDHQSTVEDRLALLALTAEIDHWNHEKPHLASRLLTDSDQEFLSRCFVSHLMPTAQSVWWHGENISIAREQLLCVQYPQLKDTFWKRSEGKATKVLQVWRKDASRLFPELTVDGEYDKPAYKSFISGKNHGLRSSHNLRSDGRDEAPAYKSSVSEKGPGKKRPSYKLSSSPEAPSPKRAKVVKKDPLTPVLSLQSKKGALETTPCKPPRVTVAMITPPLSDTGNSLTVTDHSEEEDIHARVSIRRKRQVLATGEQALRALPRRSSLGISPPRPIVPISSDETGQGDAKRIATFDDALEFVTRAQNAAVRSDRDNTAKKIRKLEKQVKGLRKMVKKLRRDMAA